jgi:hypothetical protein
MGKILPHLAGRRQWAYTAHTMNYTYTVYVTANTIQEARALGYKEATLVMGNHARIVRDEVKEA